jgi:fructose-1,6-bisphosphatase
LQAVPNPFNEELILNLPSGAEATLSDIHGKKVMIHLVSGKTDTAELAKGIYLLNIETPEKIEVQRLMKY